MPKSNPKGIRLDDATLSQIDDLAKWWTSITPLSLADIIRESIRIAHVTETRKRKPAPRTRTQA
jgi:hypothetical protein